jgi:hypothetical protein
VELGFANASLEELIDPKGATRPRGTGDDFPIGMNADGTLNIVPKEAIEAAIRMARATTNGRRGETVRCAASTTRRAPKT